MSIARPNVNLNAKLLVIGLIDKCYHHNEVIGLQVIQSFNSPTD